MESVVLQLPSEILERVDEVAGGPRRRARFFRELLDRRLAAGHAHRDPARGESLQIYVRLTPDALLKLDQAAAAAGMARSEWIAALIRRHLTAKPQFSRPDRLLIVEAHRELHRIAVLMRSLAEHLPPDDDSCGATALGTQLLHSGSGVEHQMAALRHAFNGNFAYWETADD